MGSNKKLSIGACKSYCMNFDYFQDSGFKFTLRIARSNPPQVFTGLVSWVIISSVIYLSAALHDMIFVSVIT